MTKLLTKAILLNAAALIEPTGLPWVSGQTNEKFMCLAVGHAVTGIGSDDAYRDDSPREDFRDAERAFADVLERHGVCDGGSLRFYPADGRGPRTPFEYLTKLEAQALRFDFLNLLAVSGAFN